MFVQSYTVGILQKERMGQALKIADKTCHRSLNNQFVNVQSTCMKSLQVDKRRSKARLNPRIFKGTLPIYDFKDVSFQGDIGREVMFTKTSGLLLPDHVTNALMHTAG